jgi:ubiquinone/menaquinone biosynthesis C-methylase UbiE
MTSITNTDQSDAWNGDSGQRWAEDPDRRDSVLAPVADALIAAAHLQHGESVLDIGCGCGATTLTAAKAVGHTGAATGIDISEPMLRVARQRTDDADARNVVLLHGDAQVYPLSAGAFDVAISRFGTMFFADPEAAFANIATALRPDARLCIATWQPLAANDWLTIPGAALLHYGTMPDTPAGPGMFAQSDPDVVTALLHRAGYRDIDVRPVTLTLRLGADPADATDYLAAAGVGRSVLETVPTNDQPAALAAVRTALADHAGDAGVHLAAAIWIANATRP